LLSTKLLELDESMLLELPDDIESIDELLELVAG
jgi:hypothetical protein